MQTDRRLAFEKACLYRRMRNQRVIRGLRSNRDIVARVNLSRMVLFVVAAALQA